MDEQLLQRLVQLVHSSIEANVLAPVIRVLGNIAAGTNDHAQAVLDNGVLAAFKYVKRLLVLICVHLIRLKYSRALLVYDSKIDKAMEKREFISMVEAKFWKDAPSMRASSSEKLFLCWWHPVLKYIMLCSTA